jgi:hypothetical protein
LKAFTEAAEWTIVGKEATLLGNAASFGHLDQVFICVF